MSNDPFANPYSSPGHNLAPVQIAVPTKPVVVSQVTRFLNCIIDYIIANVVSTMVQFIVGLVWGIVMAVTGQEVTEAATAV